MLIQSVYTLFTMSTRSLIKDVISLLAHSGSSDFLLAVSMSIWGASSIKAIYLIQATASQMTPIQKFATASIQCLTKMVVMPSGSIIQHTIAVSVPLSGNPKRHLRDLKFLSGKVDKIESVICHVGALLSKETIQFPAYSGPFRSGEKLKDNVQRLFSYLQ